MFLIYFSNEKNSLKKTFVIKERINNENSKAYWKPIVLYFDLKNSYNVYFNESFSVGNEKKF